MVGADVLGGPRPRGRPHACSADVPVRAARRGRRALPAGASRSPVGAARAHGGHGAFVVGADVLGGPRPRNVPVRAAWTSPCAHGRPPARGAPRTSRPTSRRIPFPSAVKLCAPPPGRCGHERTAARCAILFGLRGTDERGRVPVRGVHHGTAKRRKPKRPCV